MAGAERSRHQKYREKRGYFDPNLPNNHPRKRGDMFIISNETVYVYINIPYSAEYFRRTKLHPTP